MRKGLILLDAMPYLKYADKVEAENIYCFAAHVSSPNPLKQVAIPNYVSALAFTVQIDRRNKRLP